MNFGAGGIGAGAPPVLTDKGWLCIIHCVMPACKTVIYTAGAMLLDREDPRKVLGTTDGPILTPTEDYEINGLVPTVVFPCGAVPEPDGTLKIYYGAADRVTALATARTDELVAACLAD